MHLHLLKAYVKIKWTFLPRNLTAIIVSVACLASDQKYLLLVGLVVK